MAPQQASHRLQVVRLDLPLDAATFDGLMAAAPELTLGVHRARGDDDATWLALATAQVYHRSEERRVGKECA